MTAPEITVPKDIRPRSNDLQDYRYQWRFCRMPKKIKYEGDREFSSPFRKSAVFVVHGIGEQVYAETAATLRKGTEDALPIVEPRLWDAAEDNNWILPGPYIWDAFWARYHDFAWLEPKAKDTLSKGALNFYTRLWSQRSQGALRSVWWLWKQSWRLVVKGRGFNRIIYIVLWSLIPFISLLLLPHPKSRKFLSQYLNDVRLYLSPKGDIERHIVQRIEYTIGEEFLKLLGLDWDFEELPLDQKLMVGGERHSFENITWVAHSLGSVISYNVISDLLNKCEQFRESGKDGDDEKAARVENALSHFITIGSPLDKVAFLFTPSGTLSHLNARETLEKNTVLRAWPDSYLPGGKHYKNIYENCSRPSNYRPLFWQNFYYGTDPVSGHLDLFTNKNGDSIVKNIHTKGWRMPLASHVAYWSDLNITTRILEACFFGFTKSCNTNKRYDESKEYSNKIWKPPLNHAVYIAGQLFLVFLLIAAPILLWCHRNEIFSAIWNILNG